jgi:hypothetical protein
MRVQAQTWHTFASIELRADGSGAFAIRDDAGREIAGMGWGPESDGDADRIIRIKLPGQDVATR